MPINFPEDVLAAAEKISPVISKAEIKRRRDLRDIPTFTIDPADAKDFDDALSMLKLDNGNYQVGIHIADVSYLVGFNDPGYFTKTFSAYFGYLPSEVRNSESSKEV